MLVLRFEGHTKAALQRIEKTIMARAAQRQARRAGGCGGALSRRHAWHGPRLYSALLRAARAAAWPALWWRGRRVPAYRERWDERLAVRRWPASAPGGVLVHAVSMGD